MDKLPYAKHLLADRGYDADWFRDAPQDKGIEPRQRRTAKLSFPTIKPSINNNTKSEICSRNSKTGDISQPDIIDALIPYFSAVQIAAIVIGYLNES